MGANFRLYKNFWIVALVLGVILSVLAFGIYVLLVQEQSSSNTQIAQTAINRNTPPAIDRNGPAAIDSQLCLAGCPSGQPNTDQIVAHHILVLANNPETKFADWVAYRITKETLGSHCARTWKRDPDISEGSTLSPKDFRGIREIQSDRGHQAPLASLCGAPFWYEADYLSNITPQKTDLNEGAWGRLEGAERALLDQGYSEVYSVTGPLFEHQMQPLPNASLEAAVPSGYWKVIAVRTPSGAINAAAFLMDQNLDRGADYCGTRIQFGDLERRSRLLFFGGIAKDQRDRVEAVGVAEISAALGC